MTHAGTRETFLPCHHDAAPPRVTRPGKTFPRATSSERLRPPRSWSKSLGARKRRGCRVYRVEASGAAGVRGSATAISSLPPCHLPSPLLPLDVLHADAC